MHPLSPLVRSARAVGVLLALALCARAGNQDFLVTLEGSQEVPPTSSIAVGTAMLHLDPGTGAFSVEGTYAKLQSPPTGFHLHGPALPDQNGPIIAPLVVTGGSSGTLSGGGTLTPDQVHQVLAGHTYLNLHSNGFPAGAIRGQVMRAVFELGLDGAHEVPPVNTPGTGTASVALDVLSGEVSVSGTYQDLLGPATVAHVHGPAPPGQTAPPVFSIFLNGGTSGTFSGPAILTPQQIADMLAGLTYVQIHTEAFPAGEIRGQIGAFAECFLVVGAAPGVTDFTPAQHTFWPQLESVRGWYPVTLASAPEFPLTIAATAPPLAGTLVHDFAAPWSGRVFAVQVLMWNPWEFPQQPEQWTEGLIVVVMPDGHVFERRYGSTTGMGIDWELDRDAAGAPVIRFPFTIPGF